MTIVDAVFAETGGGYRWTEVLRLAGHTVRVQVHRDAYPEQSWAAAEVLTPHLTWTTLVNTPAAGWWTRTTGTADPDALWPVAEDLRDRARTILTLHTRHNLRGGDRPVRCRTRVGCGATARRRRAAETTRRPTRVG